MHLIVDGSGMSIGKHSQRVQIRKGGEIVSEAPILEVDQITLATKGAVISTDLIKECVEHGIQINFLDFSGKPIALLSAPGLNGTVITRRKQFEAFQTEAGTILSKQLIRGKLTNQLYLLKYFGKYRKATHSPDFAELQRRFLNITNNIKEIGSVPNVPIDQVRGRILSIEGRAGKEYWNGVKLLVKNKAPDFPGREHRGATDLVNCMLNYGYGILYSRVWGALTLAGLEPFAGFLHVDRPGKPSLVLDFIEEFRQPIVDHAVLAYLGKNSEKQKLPQGDMLSTSQRRDVSRIVEERLQAVLKYRNCNSTLKAIMLRQARLLAGCLRGESKYRPFVGGW